MRAALCTMLGHRRSRRDARRIEERWISYCRRCGRPMVRHGPQRWTVADFVNGIPQATETADQNVAPLA